MVDLLEIRTTVERRMEDPPNRVPERQNQSANMLSHWEPSKLRNMF